MSLGDNMTERILTKQILIKDLAIGGNNRIVVQSMTNTLTSDVPATVRQIKDLENAGCELVRVAILDHKDAKAIRDIKQQIRIPLVADIHFDYKLALDAIEQGVDKIRLNPGNIGNPEQIREVVTACQANHIPIRIGINSGSLEKKILLKYGRPSPEAMVESAKYHVSLLEKHGFDQIILSLKSTDMLETIEAYRLAANTFTYPLHLGITEAGTKMIGTIRSSIGLGILISENIGSTIRVSLTDDPVEEVRVAREILANFKLIAKPTLISCPTCGRIQYDMIPIAHEIERFLETISKQLSVAIMGCAVNGPGEAKEANIAICGGKKEALLYIDGELIRKIPQSEILPVLKKAILEY
ncbi:MAG: flavodoxin-dependent (E)-4-hydroxy-3-methylbut-2-enyl-diphosphate synthase [Acholeplasmataceae bacterium]|nr:flavodoxin-dependent (E)-4-hydroxy-3-methylbut-2-enyl-diphosphate synthase [Acholeplasmataceae bacterium]